MINRLYINITNVCNRYCPFCFMYSGPNNSLFMSENVYKGILNEYSFDEPYEIYLSGGEPELHPDVIEFVELALKQENVSAVLFDTNGTLLERCLPQLKELCLAYNKKIILRVSVNYYLLELDNKHLEKIKAMISRYTDTELLK